MCNQNSLDSCILGKCVNADEAASQDTVISKQHSGLVVSEGTERHTP